MPLLAGLLLFLGTNPQYTPSGFPHAPTAVSCTGITGTYTNCFTTVETPVNSPLTWLSIANPFYVSVNSTGSGAVPSNITAGHGAVLMYTGITLGASFTVRGLYNIAPSGGDGPCALDASGTGYCWFVADGNIHEFTGASIGYTVTTGCPSSVSGHIYELDITYTGGGNANLVCLDVTTSTSQSGNDGTAHTNLYPAMFLDTNSNSSLVLNNFGVN